MYKYDVNGLTSSFRDESRSLCYYTWGCWILLGIILWLNNNE